MKYEDFTGKLNDHEKYRNVIDALEKKCHYIEIVIIDDEYSSGLAEIFKADIISEKIVSKWWGTSSNARNKMYRIKASSKLFSKLKEYETFCKYHSSENGDHAEETDFGYDDIVFFDDTKEPLLFTTTHEGYITAREDLII